MKFFTLICPKWNNLTGQTAEAGDHVFLTRHLNSLMRIARSHLFET